MRFPTARVPLWSTWWRPSLVILAQYLDAIVFSFYLLKSVLFLGTDREGKFPRRLGFVHESPCISEH